jgi:hypothetical protein
VFLTPGKSTLHRKRYEDGVGIEIRKLSGGGYLQFPDTIQTYKRISDHLRARIVVQYMS